ncbi:MAG: hypothetical protein HY835_08110, partial [Anaerolineae bacterium]|nr:hypothetical protein [Anaerolineae bacterium]
SKLVENIKLLIASGFWLPMVFAVCYGFYSIRSKEIYSLKKGLVYILSIISLFSATVSSLPWARYIYLPIVLILPVVAIFVNDHIPWMVSRRYRPGWYMAVLAVVVFGLFTGYKFAQDIRLIITTHDHSAQEFSLEIQKIIPVEEPVYNWEWEIDFYANLNFAHPEYQLFPAMLDETYNHRDSAPLHEKRIPAGVHYVIVGPFATQTNLFKDELDQMNSSVLYQKGAYLLYYIH